MNLVSGRVKAIGESGVTVDLPGICELEVAAQADRLQRDEPVTVGIRPEHLRVDGQGQVQGQVIVAERLGSATYLYVQINSGEMITVETAGDSLTQIHERVVLQIEGRDCHLFNSSGEAV
jgi:multiple sugar transport system ATP-binding protein